MKQSRIFATRQKPRLVPACVWAWHTITCESIDRLSSSVWLAHCLGSTIWLPSNRRRDHLAHDFTKQKWDFKAQRLWPRYKLIDGSVRFPALRPNQSCNVHNACTLTQTLLLFCSASLRATRRSRGSNEYISCITITCKLEKRNNIAIPLCFALIRTSQKVFSITGTSRLTHQEKRLCFTIDTLFLGERARCYHSGKTQLFEWVLSVEYSASRTEWVLKRRGANYIGDIQRNMFWRGISIFHFDTEMEAVQLN